MKFLFLVFLMSACIPQHLKKYQRPNSSAFSPNQKTKSPKQSKDTVFKVGESNFKFLLSSKRVWESVLSVLIKNYNLTIVDSRNGVITTEWDSFYLDNVVYRNKVSIHLQSISRNVSTLTIHNAVEKLGQQGVGQAWLPAADSGDEIVRLVKNMAIYLNQPVPDFGKGILAKGTKANTTL